MDPTKRVRSSVPTGASSQKQQRLLSLVEICQRKLIKMLPDLSNSYIGNVPYRLLDTVLPSLSQKQLKSFEAHNPQLMDDTDILWQKFTKENTSSSSPPSSQNATATVARTTSLRTYVQDQQIKEQERRNNVLERVKRRKIEEDAKKKERKVAIIEPRRTRHRVDEEKRKKTESKRKTEEAAKKIAAAMNGPIQNLSAERGTKALRR